MSVLHLRKTHCEGLRNFVAEGRGRNGSFIEYEGWRYLLFVKDGRLRAIILVLDEKDSEGLYKVDKIQDHGRKHSAIGVFDEFGFLLPIRRPPSRSGQTETVVVSVARNKLRIMMRFDEPLGHNYEEFKIEFRKEQEM